MNIPPRHATPVAALALLAVCSCRGTSPGEGDSDAVTAAEAAAQVSTWTTAFEQGAALIADRIEVTGPSELLDHLAVRQDPATMEFFAEQGPEGLLHVYRRRPVLPIQEIVAYLDAWELGAFDELRVLHTLDDSPVIVRATGEAYYVDGTDRQRGDELEFVGHPYDPNASRAIEAALEAGTPVEVDAPDGAPGGAPDGADG